MSHGFVVKERGDPRGKMRRAGSSRQPPFFPYLARYPFLDPEASACSPWSPVPQPVD